MSEEDKRFIENYEKLLNKGYCDCNEMNCIDNNSPRRILNIVKNLQQENKQLKEEIKKYINSSDFVYDELYKKREKIEKILGDKENE